MTISEFIGPIFEEEEEEDDEYVENVAKIAYHTEMMNNKKHQASQKMT
jgi:hypothetical protein